jgi:hypothetical protein
MSLPCSRHGPQTPIDKGLKTREGYPFSLPSPSRFHLHAGKRIRSDKASQRIRLQGRCLPEVDSLTQT